MDRAIRLSVVSVVALLTLAWLGTAFGSDAENLSALPVAGASQSDTSTTTLVPAFGVSPTVVSAVGEPGGGDVSGSGPAIIDAAGQASPSTTARPASITIRPGGEVGRQIDRALALVGLDWQRLLPGWTIEFLGPRSSVQGLTYSTQRRIEVFVRSGVTDAQLAHVIAHELGHAVDVSYLAAETRRGVNVARGRAVDFPWWVAPGSTDFASGAGDWAECFAYTLVGPDGGFRSQIGETPTRMEQELIRQLIGI